MVLPCFRPSFPNPSIHVFCLSSFLVIRTSLGFLILNSIEMDNWGKWKEMLGVIKRRDSSIQVVVGLEMMGDALEEPGRNLTMEAMKCKNGRGYLGVKP